MRRTENAGSGYPEQQARESCAKVTTHHHYNPRRVRRLLDALACAVSANWLLSVCSREVLRNSVRCLRRLLLAVLSEQSHQPILLCTGQSAVQTRISPYTSSRLASQLAFFLWCTRYLTLELIGYNVVRAIPKSRNQSWNSRKPRILAFTVNFSVYMSCNFVSKSVNVWC